MLKVVAFKPSQQTLLGQYKLHVVVVCSRSTRLRRFYDMAQRMRSTYIVALVNVNFKVKPQSLLSPETGDKMVLLRFNDENTLQPLKRKELYLN